MNKQPLLVCIVGPTAIGKTSLSIEIAKAFHTEIVSADSRQFYKETTIGTAVPSKEELEATQHHFIQNRSVFDDYSVGDFEKDAIDLLSSLFLKNNIIVLVGGSGLYVDAVVKGLDHFPSVPLEIREELNLEFTSKGIEALQKELKKVDETYYEKVDIHNHHRIIRALEIFRATGLPYSSFLRSSDSQRSFNTLFIGLSAERELIYKRINQRVDIMISEGLVEEAKRLYPHKSLNALQTVGYRELFRHFEGEISLEKGIEEIKKNTRRFAKRQMTWNRRNEDIHWFPFDENPSKIVEFIKEKTPNMGVSE